MSAANEGAPGDAAAHEQYVTSLSVAAMRAKEALGLLNSVHQALTLAIDQVPIDLLKVSVNSLSYVTTLNDEIERAQNLVELLGPAGSKEVQS